MSKIVLIAPSGSVDAALTRLRLPSWPDTVGVISWVCADSAADGVDARAVGSPGSSLSARLSRLLSGNPLGRNVLRLSPLDGGRRLYRAVRRDSTAREMLRAADVVVVLERDGILTGWHAARRWTGSGTRVVYGLAPAESLLRSERAGA
ncbi:hypothetical protein GCM10022286_29060 [Gryllotalpicola daejeonensis]|uniref:Universal stress protein n=1 Tax=Gryllotalpicola daejeonensis TaxID=993087 RepID=A0ABP7ZN86_9MICO